MPAIVEDHGYIQDTRTGLYVPMNYDQNLLATSIATYFSGQYPGRGFNSGLEIDRDENTLAAKFPRKGSGFDDYLAQCIVDGYVANIGASPVIAPQISGMVKRQQNQAMTATIDVTGRRTPTRAAQRAISMFNDSPLGINDAVETMVYRLCTYNRGSPIATVPILISFDEWEAEGLIAHPIGAEGQSSKYWLEADRSRLGTPVPYLPHPFDLEATGNANWPYWYRATKTDGSRVWVLLSSEHIIPVVPGKSAIPGIGLSPVWNCLGYLAEQILIDEERVEKMLYTLTDGIILIGGVHEIDPQKDILNKIGDSRREQIERGFAVGKGTAIIASPVDQVSFAQISLRQPPGIEFKEWREWSEDVIAFCFGEPLSALVVRGGVGYGAQSGTASDNAMDAGIGAHLGRIGAALGAIYPRVMITVTRVNDRAARLNIQTLGTFATASTQLINTGVITPEQANAIIDRDILPLPVPGDVTTSTDAKDNQTEGLEAGYYDTLYDQTDVTITDADVDLAIERARTRVNEDVAALLTASSTEN